MDMGLYKDCHRCVLTIQTVLAMNLFLDRAHRIHGVQRGEAS